MRKASNIHLLQIIIMIILSILNILVFNIDNLYIFAIILFILNLSSYIFCGYERNNYRYKKDLLIVLISNIIIFFMVTYFIGIFVGFLKNQYSTYIVNIIHNTLPYILIIVLREFFRYLFYTKSGKNKLLISLGFLFFVLLDINMNISMYDIFTNIGIVKMVCFVIIPSLAKNILLTYIITRFGYENTIIYSLIMELYKFILPIFPDFGDYINIVIIVVYQIFLIFSINEKFFKSRKIVTSRYYKRNLSFYSVITALLVIMVMLTSGYFKYYAVAIGSGSMTPNINKGDVVIVNTLKQNELDTIKMGDVLVYKHEQIIVVHRLVDIVNLKNKVYYITKGDNNLTKDNYYIDQKDVIGIVLFRARYVGYPTVILNERIRGN